MATKESGFEFFFDGINAINGRTAASDILTKKIDLLDYSRAWEVYVSRTLTTGNPRWTIEASYDGTDWYLYDEDVENLSIPEYIRESVIYPRFIRINYEARGATGNMTMVFVRTNPA